MGAADPTDTSNLVARALEGSHEAFTELVTRYHDAACAVAYTYLGSFDDVQDAVQEAFVHAYVHLNQLKEPGKFGPWLRRITANTCVTRLRKRKLEPLSIEEIGEQASSVADPEKATMRLVVQSALSRLSEDMRLTVTLAYINGYSHCEVADFLEVPLDTVRSRLKHAKRKLREEMIGMVHDVLHEDKPDEELVKRVLESTERLQQTMDDGTLRDVLHCIDDQLQTIELMEADPAPGDKQRQLISAVEQISPVTTPEDTRAVEKLRSFPPQEFYKQVKADLMRRRLDAFTRFGREQESGEALDEYLRFLLDWGNREWLADALRRMAERCMSESKHDCARDYYQKAADVSSAVNDDAGMAGSLWSLGNLLLLECKTDEARTALHSSSGAVATNNGTRIPSDVQRFSSMH